MTETTTAPSVDVEALRASVRDEYRAVAADPDRGFHFLTGARLAGAVAYPRRWIEALPERAVASMAGTGNPLGLGELGPGNRVVDAGSGAGADALIAASLVGPDGAVIGVDMTEEMVALARANAAAAGATNVEFRLGFLEEMPVASEWADVVISNGVLNLVPDKAAALAEMRRVLRSGGRLLVSDIVLERPVSGRLMRDVSLWTGCIAGGLLEDDLRELVVAAGVARVELVPATDVVDGAALASSAGA